MKQTQVQNPKEIIKSTIRELKDQRIYEGFPTSKRIPNFEIINQNGDEKEIYDILDENEFIILNFFRGAWCGYCKGELEELNNSLNEFENFNAKVISIAPQEKETLKQLKADKELQFDLYSDPNLQIAKMFNIVWEIPSEIRDIYLHEFDLNIKKLNSNNSWHLPVPATYIIANSGNVIAKFEDLNYSKRMSKDKILSNLESYSVSN